MTLLPHVQGISPVKAKEEMLSKGVGSAQTSEKIAKDSLEKVMIDMQTVLESLQHHSSDCEALSSRPCSV